MHEPDETGSKHRTCGQYHGFLEGGDGGEGAFELLFEVGGHGGFGGGEAVEEEVIVMGHGGVVEGWGVDGIAGVFDSYVFG